MQNYNVTIRGIVPLLLHNPESSGMKIGMVRKQGEGSMRPNEKEVMAYCEGCLYRNEKGKISVPSLHLENSMKEASKSFKMPGGGGKKNYSEIVKAMVFVHPELLPIKNQKWEPLTRPVKDKIRKDMHWHSTPMFREWEIDMEVRVMDDRMDEDTIKSILEYAGMYKAIGAWRPRHGRFEVTKFEKKTK